MIELTIKATNQDEVEDVMKVISFYHSLTFTPSKPVPKEHIKPANAPASKPRPKAAPAAEVAEEEPAAAPAPKKYTEDDVKAALLKLGKEKGAPALKAVLAKFNAQKVAELDADHYADVMAELGQ